MPSIDRRWRLEQSLLWTRWLAVTVWLALIPFIPIVSREGMAAVAVVFACGNGSVRWLLRGPPSVPGLRRVQIAASVTDWFGTTGAVALCSDELALIIPAGYCILILVCGIRFRWPSVIIATCAAILLTGMSFLEHRLIGHFETGDAVRAFVAWAVLLGCMGAVTGIHIRLGDVARLRRAAELAEFRRERLGLSRREWQVLELLVAERLTYQAIADRLSINHSTVRTHVQHLGGKLGVSGNRRAVEQRAKELDLFPSEDDLDT